MINEPNIQMMELLFQVLGLVSKNWRKNMISPELKLFIWAQWFQ